MPVSVASADDLRGVIEHLQQHDDAIAALNQSVDVLEDAVKSLETRVTALEQGNGGTQPPQPGTIINSLPWPPEWKDVTTGSVQTGDPNVIVGAYGHAEKISEDRVRFTNAAYEVGYSSARLWKDAPFAARMFAIKYALKHEAIQSNKTLFFKNKNDAMQHFTGTLLEGESFYPLVGLQGSVSGFRTVAAMDLPLVLGEEATLEYVFTSDAAGIWTLVIKKNGVASNLYVDSSDGWRITERPSISPLNLGECPYNLTGILIEPTEKGNGSWTIGPVEVRVA